MQIPQRGLGTDQTTRPLGDGVTGDGERCQSGNRGNRGKGAEDGNSRVSEDKLSFATCERQQAGDMGH